MLLTVACGRKRPWERCVFVGQGLIKKAKSNLSARIFGLNLMKVNLMQVVYFLVAIAFGLLAIFALVVAVSLLLMASPYGMSVGALSLGLVAVAGLFLESSEVAQ